MRNNWQTKRLSDICEVLDSKRKPISQKDRIAGQYPYYGATGIVDYVNDYLFNEDLILIGEDGAKWGIGERTAFSANGKYWVNNHAHVIRPDRNKVYDNWIINYINNSDLTEYITGVTVSKLNQEKLRSIEIPIPPLSEQQRIIFILDQTLAPVAKAKELIEKNIKNSQELFDSYLTKTFNKPLENWTVCRMEENIKFIDYRGKTPHKTQSGLRLITAKNVKNGFLRKFPEEFVDEDVYSSWMVRGIPKKDDVLFTTEAPLANVAQLDIDDKVVFAQRIIILQPDRNILNATFLKYLMLSKPIKRKILEKGTGATVQGIKASLLKKIEIYFPKSLSSQEYIIKDLDELSAQKKHLERIYQRKLKLLEELKKSILNKAFSGEL